MAACESATVAHPPHPDPLPPRWEREHKRRAIVHRAIQHGERHMHGHVRKTGVARRFRRNSTIAEQRLWYQPRSRSLCGMKFVRQEPVGPYIVDFVCREHRIVVEVDGGQHCKNERDLLRDQWLHDHGYRVLRFWKNDVLGNIKGVVEVIANASRHDGRAPSSPLGGEGRGEGGVPQRPALQGHNSPADAQTRGMPPSFQPSPPKGGEGARCGEE
jgi:very-short-patch-repair endonuclease